MKVILGSDLIFERHLKGNMNQHFQTPQFAPYHYAQQADCVLVLLVGRAFEPLEGQANDGAGRNVRNFEDH